MATKHIRRFLKHVSQLSHTVHKSSSKYKKIQYISINTNNEKNAIICPQTNKHLLQQNKARENPKEIAPAEELHTFIKPR
jgi:hypothetical protein